MPNISIVRGSLVDQDVEYIVNAANPLMRGGGGIDGLIHRLAGPKLLLELQRKAPRGCEIGEVVVTSAHQLKHKGIVHTPGPIWRGGTSGEPDLLANSYRNSLQAIHELGGRSIAFCSISTGSYRYPIEPAADIALNTAFNWASTHKDSSINQVIFAMHGEKEYLAFLQALATIDQLR